MYLNLKKKFEEFLKEPLPYKHDYQRWNLYNARFKDPPPPNTVRLPGLWAGLSKGDCYLPGIHRPRGQACVYRFDIHRKSLRPEEYIWKL